jgi:nucleoside-diphosphate-sugar epimerase
MAGTALILGGHGRFGRNAANAFRNAAWQVRGFDRASDSLPEAAQGADLIVNGWNPTYDRWAAELPGLTAQVIGAAKASGATVLIPGNVYVFGAEAPEEFGPSVPHGATNPLGRLRAEMEASYRASGVRTIVLRAGDFIDTEGSGNWFDRVVAARLDSGILTYPGPLDVPHAWAYLPDVARAAVELAAMREDLPRFAEIPFPGYTLTGRELAQACAAALGRPVRARQMAWWPIQAARPVWPMARHIVEMRYLWDKPHRLEGETFRRFLPDFRETPMKEALAHALGEELRVAA